MESKLEAISEEGTIVQDSAKIEAYQQTPVQAYEGLRLVHSDIFAGGTSIKYWM
jgi:hypothetical protein